MGNFNMVLDKFTPVNMIEIRSPRWKERTIGIAHYRVGMHNSIEIQAKDKEGKLYYPNTYYMSGEDIKKHDIQKLYSGTTLYLVPISELEILERN
jgi:hypothetical protein